MSHVRVRGCFVVSALVFLVHAWSASARDSVVVFNEIHYHPARDDTSLEYVELYNQTVLDIDMSNWRIDGDIDFDFPEGTVLGGGQYLVIAKNPSALALATGFLHALGPYNRDLSNSGDPVLLYNNNRSFRTEPGGTGSAGEVTAELEGRRIMDEIHYQDTAPWPVGPDGSGFTLAKRDPSTGTGYPEHWRSSTQFHGTPGSANTFSSLPTLAFNELAAVDAPLFQVELYNYGEVAVELTDFVIGLSTPLHPEYTFPTHTLSTGAFLVVDAADLGYVPEDNNRLFLYSSGKAALIDAARVDDRAAARNPDGTGEWARPDSSTFGTSNLFSIADSMVINEILYHAYPQRAVDGTPPGMTELLVLSYDATWRYNLDAGTDGLPSGWASSSHPVDGVSWSSGPGLLGVENTNLGEPLRTTITMTSQITYYFETDFTYDSPLPVTQMIINHYIDDGAVFYLNGEEIGRFNMAAGNFDPTTLADVGVGNASLNALVLPAPGILQGTNRLSVEVHQTTSTSSDIVCGAQVLLLQSDETGTPGSPFVDRDEEWVELYNRSAAPVDLGGWKLNGGIDYDFPDGTVVPAEGYLVVAKDAAAVSVKHPAAMIIGDYANRLGDGGDRFSLEDPSGNVVDQVRYEDSGKWHAAADGGGSSLELKDPDSDNAVAGAWAPSDESLRSEWQTYTYEAVAVDDSIGVDAFHEFIIALLDAGEFLLDDVSVVENGSIEFIQNGDFESDTPGATADTWRAIGTHGSHDRTVVVTDPEDPGNKCLHVVSTGSTENKHNKLETTFADDETVVVGNAYRISFRAKWISGMNLVNTRLYFNYLQRTTALDVPERWGTPGWPNTAAVGNAGPDLEQLSHHPVIPEANQEVTVSIEATDPDSLSNLTLYYSINDATYQSTGMSAGMDGRYFGIIPGQAASAIIRFYVRGEDGSGATSFSPAGATEGGAFCKVQDGFADATGLRHNFRIIMSDRDRTFLYLNTNRMSNDRFPATVIEDETTVYYDVGIRLKGSAHGRYSSTGHGFNVEFQPDQFFRGVHNTVSIERPGAKELLAKCLLNRAGGGYWTFYEDVAHVITPAVGNSGVALLSMARHTKTFWDGLFPDADDPGVLFNLELHYAPTSTTGGPEDLKIGKPYTHTKGAYDFKDRGFNKEAYRWGFQLRSARDRDDYSRIVALNQAMELSGEALKQALDPLIDVNQWMRTFAMMSLNGTDDVYGRLWEHNLRFFVRPTDQKVIILQWDLDRAFGLSTGASVIPTVNKAGEAVVAAKLFAIPEYRRIFDGHLDDLAQTTMNSAYAAPLASHLSTITGANLNSYPNYIASRAATALSSLPPAEPFAVTTNGGSDFSEEDSTVDLQGVGWVDVFAITVNGIETPVTWSGANSWEITVPIRIGANRLQLAALNNRGAEVGSDTITVTNSSAIDLARAGNTVISELHYHPADPSPEERSAGFTDADDFEFVELANISAADIDLTNVRFSNGVEFTTPVGTLLAPGERLVVVADRAAFEFRYGTNTVNIAGEYVGQFSNGSEHVRLDAADGTAIADFTYYDDLPWPTSADGIGFSLILCDGDPGHAFDWRTSTTVGGNPGSTDSISFPGDDLWSYAFAGAPTPIVNADSFLMNIHLNLAADDALLAYTFSTNLVNWVPGTNVFSRTNHGDGTATMLLQSPFPVSTTPTQFGGIRIEVR